MIASAVSTSAVSFAAYQIGVTVQKNSSNLLIDAGYGTSSITFNMNHNTGDGKSMYLFYNVNSTGDNVTKMTWTTGNVWTYTLSVPNGASVAYKYLYGNTDGTGDKTWEGYEGNRTMTATDSGYSTSEYFNKFWATFRTDRNTGDVNQSIFLVGSMNSWTCSTSWKLSCTDTYKWAGTFLITYGSYTYKLQQAKNDGSDPGKYDTTGDNHTLTVSPATNNQDIRINWTT